MTAPLLFEPRLAFGKLDLLQADGGRELETPVELLDRPDVLAALATIAANGGRKWVQRARDSEILEVDVDADTVAVREWAE